MIRPLRALAWMRFRLFINGMKRTGRRDTLEQISRAVASVLPVVLVIALVPSAIALAVAGFFGGRALAGGGNPASWWWAGTRLGLFALTLMVALLPLLRGAGSGESGLTRLLLLPIARRVMLFSELTAAFGDPWLGLLVPFLVALPLGLAAGGAPAAALVALGAAVTLLFALAALSACGSLGLTLIFRNRRRGEWLTIFAVSLALLIPMSSELVDDWFGKRGPPGGGRTASAPPSPPPATLDEKIDRLLPRAARVLPGELYVTVVKAWLSGARAPGSLASIGLIAWCGAFTAGAGALHRRLLESPGGTRRRSSALRGATRLTRLPGLTHAASAVALATLRSALRTVRGKIAVYLNVPILAMLLVLFRVRPELQLPEGSLVGLGQLGAIGGMLLSSLSMHPVTLNLFAIDRGGLTRQFLAPISFRDLVLGKLAAGMGLIAGSTALCAAVAVAVAPHGHPAVWAALPFVFVSSHLILGPLSVLLSAVFPKHSDLSRLGKPGNPHGLAGLLGFLLVIVTLAPPTLLTALALFGLNRPLLGVLFPAAWTALAALASLPLMRLAILSVERRAENLILVAEGR